MCRKLYLVVTKDEYELPMFVGDLHELARYLGRTENSIKSNISHGNWGNIRKVDDDEGS